MSHVTWGRNCWCHPEILQPCPECTSGPTKADEHYAEVYSAEPCDPNCWKCDGRGLVPEFDQDLPVVIVHNEKSRE